MSIHAATSIRKALFMKIFLAGSIFCCALLIACQQTISTTSDISIVDANSTTKADVSDLFHEITAAPLQTTKESLVGMMVMTLSRLDDRLFLLNKMVSRSNLLCFDTTGRFIYSIDRMGHGPQEYTYLGDFITNPDSAELVLTTEKGKYLVFDTTGNYVSHIQEEPPIFYYRQFIRTNDSTCVVFHDGAFPRGSDLLEVDSRTFAIRRSAQATDPLASEGARPLSLWSGRMLYYNMNDTIYDATDIQNRKPAYYLDFGDSQRETEEKFRRKLDENRHDAQDLLVESCMQEKYSLVTRLFENEGWIAASALKQDPAAKPNELSAIPFFILYDKETGKTYNSDKLSWDVLNLGPLTNIDIVGCDEAGTFYAVWYGVPSEKQKQKIRSSGKLPQEVKDRLLELEEGDNPVLFMLR